jgi:hypothetical protein
MGIRTLYLRFHVSADCPTSNSPKFGTYGRGRTIQQDALGKGEKEVGIEFEY